MYYPLPTIVYQMGTGFNYSFLFIGGSDGKESAWNAGDPGLIPGLGRSPGRAWQPTPVFLPGEFHRQRKPVGYSPWGRKEWGHDWETNTLTFSIVAHLSCLNFFFFSPNNYWAPTWLVPILKVVQKGDMHMSSTLQGYARNYEKSTMLMRC